MPDVTEVIDAQLDAYNARDLERFVACHAAGVVITNASGDVLAEGHDGMRQMYAGLFENSPQLAATIHNRIVVGEFVADGDLAQTGQVHKAGRADVVAVRVYRAVRDQVEADLSLIHI